MMLCRDMGANTKLLARVLQKHPSVSTAPIHCPTARGRDISQLKKNDKSENPTPRLFYYTNLINIGANIYFGIIAQGIVSETNNTMRYFPKKAKVTDLKIPRQDLSAM